VKVEVRHLHSPEEADLAAALQRDVWGIEDVPSHVMLTAAHNGGFLAGAFVDGTPAGFAWGFLGFDDRVAPPRLKHCSHQLGVLPVYRNLGLGFLLKRFQWEYVLGQGVGLITWTYDPLLATNAQLNIARLGAVCNTYRRNEYGDLNDDLNAGLPTDRFQVDVWTKSERVRAAMTGAGKLPVSSEAACHLNLPSPDGTVAPPSLRTLGTNRPSQVAVAIPPDFQSQRAIDRQFAVAWRYATREVFETLFADGYTVAGFARAQNYGCYILQRDADFSV
jgi:predicted GNAT superfamily acetyltransferase